MITGFQAFEDVDVATLLPLAGLLIGLAFGFIAQKSRFCLRSAVISSTRSTLSPMAGSFALAMIMAIIGTQTLGYLGMIDLEATRFISETMPLGALVLGGMMFGAGMVLTRGCASRLTVLSAQGNLRAVTVLMVFAIFAYATLRGVFAAPRVAFTDATSTEMMAQLPPIAATVLIALLGIIAWRSRVRPGLAIAGILVGLLIVTGWFATGALLVDEFDPRAAESLAFTSGASDALFFTLASTAIDASFGAGLLGGTVIGAFLSAALHRELRLESFEDPQQTLRYFAGGALMGSGGVLAGGCTIGAGLTGVSTLAFAPMIALIAIVAGAAATNAVLTPSGQRAYAAVAAE